MDGGPMRERERSIQIVKKLYALLDWRQRGSLMAIILIMIISSILTQLTPKAIGWLTDDILMKEQIRFLDVIPVLLIILAVNVGNELIKIRRRLMVEDTATKTEKKARGMALTALLRAPLSFFKENMTGNIHGRLNRCLEGTVKLEKLIFMDLAPAVFNSIAAVAVIFTTLPVRLALPMLLVIPVGVAIVLRQISTQRGIRVELLETKASMDGAIVELLNGIQVIRVADSIAQEEERFDRKSEQLRGKEMEHHIQMAGYDRLKFINEAVFTVLMIGISVYLAAQGRISVGAVLTSYLCFAQLIKPLDELHRILDELSESMVLAEDFFRIAEIKRDFSYEVSPKSTEEKKNGSDSIELHHVSFAYQKDKKVLEDLDLRIEKGMFIGVAGPSGCGKSSLIKAICKLEQYEGEILIHGTDLRTLSRKRIAQLIALVPQDPFLIAGTIYENICYGLDRQPGIGEVEAAVEKAHLSELIESMPDNMTS